MKLEVPYQRKGQVPCSAASWAVFQCYYLGSICNERARERIVRKGKNGNSYKSAPILQLL